MATKPSIYKHDAVTKEVQETVKQASAPSRPAKPTLEQMRLRDAELVKGRFTFTEVPGGTLEFSYRRYKKDKTKSYRIKDGDIVTIPRGVAKHLATSGRYPVHEYATDAKGNPVLRIGRMKSRYNFESLEFFDENDLQPSRIYTAEHV